MPNSLPLVPEEQKLIDVESDSTLEWPTERDELIDAQSSEADINEAELYLDEQTDYLTSLDPIIKDEVVHLVGLCRQDIYIYRFGEDQEEILFDHYRQVVESVSVLKFLSAPDMDTAKAHITAQELLKSKSHAVKESDKHMLIACVTYLLLSSQLSRSRTSPFCEVMKVLKFNCLPISGTGNLMISMRPSKRFPLCYRAFQKPTLFSSRQEQRRDSCR